jgi:transcriptional regulator with XRE-family HTH domain
MENSSKPAPVSKTAEELLQALAGNIRALRINQGLSQQEAAAKAGLSLRTLVNLEDDGRSTVETLLRVLRALGVAEPLSALVPEVRVSPMTLLRSAGAAPQRVRKRRMEQASSPFPAPPPPELQSQPPSSPSAS